MEQCRRFDHIVHDAAGLHARPAANLARFIAGLTSDVTVEANGKRVNGKSALFLMSLGVASGACIHVELHGEHAESEADELRLYCKQSI